VKLVQILLTVAYDGTNYAGWQRQENAITVQEKVEAALSALYSHDIKVRAASRTDAGVHALGQHASFFVDESKIPVDKIPLALLGILPPDIAVTKAEIVSEDFHPQYDAKQKTYVYKIHTVAIPLLNRFSAFVPRELDIYAMKEAAGFFVGRHDFVAFCATGGSAKTTVREVFSCAVCEYEDITSLGRVGNIIQLEITGGGFLYNMVRIIAGTLVYVGMGKIPPKAVPDIIASKDRTKAGKTMPPHGLVLVEVEY